MKEENHQHQQIKTRDMEKSHQQSKKLSYQEDMTSSAFVNRDN